MTKSHQLLAIIALFIFSSCQPGLIKVLCMGDSITQGKVTADTISELNYRFWLWEKLDSAGYKVDMLGSNSIWFHENRLKKLKSLASHYTAHLFDRHHEGFYGITTGEFLKGGFTHDSISYPSLHDRLLRYETPDIAFIHIGTNDKSNDSLQTINYLKQIIEELHFRNPRVKVFLAKLNTPWVRFVNHSVEPVVAEFKEKYPKLRIVPVDMASGWVNCPQATGAMTLDWAHPNTLGQKVMAEKWFKAFKSFGDHKKPSFISSTKVYNLTHSTATVHWTAAKDNLYLAGYTIFLNDKPVNWRTSDGDKKEIQCLALVQGNSFTFTGLKKGVEYTVRISAVDFGNNTSVSKDAKFIIP